MTGPLAGTQASSQCDRDMSFNKLEHPEEIEGGNKLDLTHMFCFGHVKNE
jgi:hypothetical protein